MTPPRARPGGLVVLEGIDGSGKSSVAARLARRWRARGWTVLRTREPHRRSFGRAALDLARGDPWASATLFSLDRLLARPSLDAAIGRGAIVLQDRSYYSTLAYQADRLPADRRRRLQGLQTRIARRPDRVLWLDLPPRDALRRVRGRGREASPVERLRFLAQVRAAYEELACPPVWIRVEAARPLAEVVDRADEALTPWLRTHGVGRRPR